MITWGITALNHDASIAVIKDDKLAFWAQSRNYTYLGDELLCKPLIYDVLAHGKPDQIAWYERPLIKKFRQLYAGQYADAFDSQVLPSNYLNKLPIPSIPIKYFSHHKTHAAAGFYTSTFDSAAIVVLDAIGEWESASIWKGTGKNLTKLWSVSYPTSLGLFYSAFTKLIGYKPLAEEHLLQRDSELGAYSRYYETVADYFKSPMQARYNLHRGVYNWPHKISSRHDRYDIATAVQRVFEEQVIWVMYKALELTGDRNLVYMGGCAMNSKARQHILPLWDNVWGLAVPGDSSSAIGAALLLADTRIAWPS